MKTMTAAVLLAALAVAVPAHSHDGDKHENIAAENGGQLRAAGELYLELVLARGSREAKPNPAALYVSDHAGKKLPTAGAIAKVTLMSKRSGRQEIALTPDGANVLRGTGTYASDPDLVAVAVVTLPGKKPEQARFTPLAP